MNGVSAARKRDSAGGAGHDPSKAEDTRQSSGTAGTLSGLEAALKQALASLPRDQVVRCIMTTLPAKVLVDPETPLHGGKVRKVSVSMPEELTDAVRGRSGAGGFSRYVTEAVQEQIRLDLLDDLAAEFEEKYGPIDEDLLEEAMREWPDYEEE
jgi:hypothetical protein